MSSSHSRGRKDANRGIRCSEAALGVAVPAGFGGALGVAVATGVAAAFGGAFGVDAGDAHFKDGRPRLGAAGAADADLDDGCLRFKGAAGQTSASLVDGSSPCTSS